MSSELLASAQTLVAMALLGVALLAVPRALLLSWESYAGAPFARAMALAAIGMAALLRLFAPFGLATVFVGYRWTQQCIDLYPVPHYGIGGAAFYHALLAFLPHDHLSLIGTNAVVGVLTVPLVAALASRLFEDRRAGAFAALFVAVVPLFIRNDTSDANNVPILLWLVAGLVLLEHHARTRRTSSLVLSLCLLSLAAISRPEMPAVAFVWSAVVVLGSASRRELLADWKLWLALAAGAVLVVPHTLHIFGMVGELQGRSSLPGLSWHELARPYYLLVESDTLVEPRLFPIGVFGLAVFALVRPPALIRGRVWLLGAATLLTLLAYFPDIDRANMARVHVPAALLTALLAGLGAVRATRSRAAELALGIVVALSILPTAWTLWRPTNEAAEETSIRGALAVLPAQGAFTLVRTSFEDRPPDDRLTHEHFPDYLLDPERARILSVSEWEQRPDWSQPAYFYFGMRCYARFRTPDLPSPTGENLQPHCARMSRRFRLVPVREWSWSNRGDVWIHYYGDAERLRLGLFRIRSL